MHVIAYSNPQPSGAEGRARGAIGTPELHKKLRDIVGIYDFYGHFFIIFTFCPSTSEVEKEWNKEKIFIS